LSLNPCKPFDADRDGLNVGEAAAAIVLSAQRASLLESQPASENQLSDASTKLTRNEVWEIVEGAVRNDANHISGPSRTGEGSYHALRYVLDGVSADELAFVNVHGTATRYNDQMEAIAINRAGLQDVPVNALKGIFGHTMGAAGILESIVSMAACDAGVVLPTHGFSQMGVEPAVNVSAQERKTDKKAFVKLLSGFGGVNGALLFRKGGAQ
jgi:3-oxoacyl-[acyl-carrier-protein] synthase-1